LDCIYIYQKLTEDQINWAIKKGKNLDVLYACQKMSEENINNAIKLNRKLDILYQFKEKQNIKPYQLNKILKILKLNMK